MSRTRLMEIAKNLETASEYLVSRLFQKAWQRRDGSWWDHDPKTGKVVPYKGKKGTGETAKEPEGEYKPQEPDTGSAGKGKLDMDQRIDLESDLHAKFANDPEWKAEQESIIGQKMSDDEFDEFTSNYLAELEDEELVEVYDEFIVGQSMAPEDFEEKGESGQDDYAGIRDMADAVEESGIDTENMTDEEVEAEYHNLPKDEYAGIRDMTDIVEGLGIDTENMTDEEVEGKYHELLGGNKSDRDTNKIIQDKNNEIKSLMDNGNQVEATWVVEEFMHDQMDAGKLDQETFDKISTEMSEAWANGKIKELDFESLLRQANGEVDWGTNKTPWEDK